METQARSSETGAGRAAGSVDRLRGPLTADGTAFLESLRARRQLDHLSGTHTFSPDETAEQRDERITRQLAGLRRLEEMSAQMTEEEQQIWADTFESIAQSRRKHDSVNEESHAS